MKWLPIRNPDGSVEKYSVRSDCGQYHVTQTSHTSGDWQYASIHRKEIIGTSFSSEAEKQRCADHKGNK